MENEKRESLIEFVKHMMNCANIHIHVASFDEATNASCKPINAQIVNDTEKSSVDSQLHSFTLGLEKSNMQCYVEVCCGKVTINVNDNTNNTNSCGTIYVSIMDDVMEDFNKAKIQYDQRQFEKSLQTAMSITGFARKHRLRKFI